MRQPTGTSATRNISKLDDKKGVPQTAKHSSRPSIGFDKTSRTSSRQGGRDSSTASLANSTQSGVKRGTIGGGAK